MINNFKNNRIFLFCTTLLLCLSIIVPQSKAESYFETVIYPEEKAVFSFYRATEEAPNFDTWIINSDRYLASPKDNRKRFLLKEKLRLGRGFGLYDHKKNLLEMSLDVFVKYIPATEEDKPRVVFEIQNIGTDVTPTFNYPYGKDIVSLVIESLLLFSNIELNKIQNESLLKKIPYEGDVFDGTLNISIRIKNADIKNPIKLGKKKHQWMMLGEIAYLKCNVDEHYSGEEYTLWDYIAPWYEEEFRIKNMPEEDKYPHPYDLFQD